MVGEERHSIRPIRPLQLQADDDVVSGVSIAPAPTQGTGSNAETGMTAAASISSYSSACEAAPNVTPCGMAPPSGPMTNSIAMPPRPKPGRKAIAEVPDDKRRAQNREAQRKFRERRNQTANSLELENHVLRRNVRPLTDENRVLRNQLTASKTRIGQLEDEIKESKRRVHELDSRWNAALKNLTDFQQRSRDAEQKAALLEERLNEATALISTLRHAYPQISTQTPSFIAAASMQPQSNAPFSFSQAQVPPQAAQIVPRIPSERDAPDGCGDCEESGACYCVDSYLDDTQQAQNLNDLSLISRKPSSATTSIPFLLSPSRRGNLLNPHADVPDLVNDPDSPEDMETDFTQSHHNVSVTAPRVDDDTCGLFPADQLYVGSEASLQSESVGPMSNMGPPRTIINPGSCVQCQQNPEQKAYCESLARDRQTDDELSEEQPGIKRMRLDSPKFAVPCAAAFQMFKRFSTSGEQPNVEELYKDLTNFNPTNRSGTGVGYGLESQRKFSAFETDIATVIANLHRRGSSSASSFAESRGESLENRNTSSAISTPERR